MFTKHLLCCQSQCELLIVTKSFVTTLKGRHRYYAHFTDGGSSGSEGLTLFRVSQLKAEEAGHKLTSASRPLTSIVCD